jgi:hypothetical protein
MRRLNNPQLHNLMLYLTWYWEVVGYSPNRTQMAYVMNVSRETVVRRLRALQALGYIAYIPYEPRCTRVLRACSGRYFVTDLEEETIERTQAA